jgi:putative ABC transport system permease protein
MEVLPILCSLGRNKIGAVLIGMQIALTLAIVCNCLSIIQEYSRQMRSPSGIDEANIFTVRNSWAGQPQDLKARIAADLASLRSLPGVVDVEATNAFPLSGFGWGSGISTKPDQRFPTAITTEYFVDEHGLAAYGMKLTAGRWFSADEVGDLNPGDGVSVANVVVTQALARALFPSGDALGRITYLSIGGRIHIIGIVDRAQAPWAGVGRREVEYSIFVPLRFLQNGLYYVVRSRPGALATAMRPVRDRLNTLTRRRIISSVVPFQQTRHQTYQSEHSLSVLLGILCGLLLTVTGCGIVGLALFWVAQRRRQIGMRRALGARRLDIARYFHIENLLIAGTGAVVGIAVGLAGNTWLAATLALTRMSAGYICVGALIVLALSQAAVLWPALRAAAIPPAAAIRDL